MAKRINPSLVGAFVLAAFLLVIAGILLLGGGDWFALKRRFVIYFEGSIKGLTVGAPVTFKGVTIGRVGGLRVHYIKESGKTEIPVLIDLEPNKVIAKDSDIETAKILKQMIDQGLRAQMTPESLITNQQVIQLDFYPGTPVHLAESTLPYLQIPTIPSSFDQLQSSVGIAAQNLPELAQAATNALNQVSALLSPANQQKVSHILANVDSVSSDLAAHGADIAKTLVSLQQTAEQLNHVVADIDKILGENRQTLGSAVSDLAKTAESARKLSDQLNGILAESRHGIADFTNSSLYDLAGLIADSRSLVRRANDTLDQINRDPSRYLFGNNDQGVPAK